jgi:hypothetical protein
MDRLFPPSTTRLVFHFAVTYAPGRVVTMKSESHPGEATLQWWKLDDDLGFTLDGESEIPSRFFGPHHVLDANQLVLYYNDDLVRVDLATRAATKLETSDLRACALVNGALYEIRKDGMYTGGNRVLAAGGVWGRGNYARALGDNILWATQDGMITIETTNPKVGKRVRLDNVSTVPVAVADSIALIEIHDTTPKRAISIVQAGTITQKLYPDHRGNAWVIDGSKLYVVLGSAKEAALVKVIDMTTGAEIEAFELDARLTDSQEESQTVWCGVTDKTFAALLGAGGLVRVPRTS